MKNMNKNKNMSMTTKRTKMPKPNFGDGLLERNLIFQQKIIWASNLCFQPQCWGAGAGEKASAPACCCETQEFCDSKVATILKMLYKF